MAGTFRVLLVDDHTFVRRGIREVVREIVEDAVFGEAGTEAEAMALAAEGEWNLVVLDLSLGETSGLTVLTAIKQRWPQYPVLILSMYEEREYAVRAFSAGASGYVAKSAAADELPKAIQQIRSGRRYVTPTVAADLLASTMQKGDAPLHAKLSNREMQILCMIGTGKTVTDIAKLLGLSEHTISTYRIRIMKKLRAKSTAELVRYVIIHSLA